MGTENVGLTVPTLGPLLIAHQALRVAPVLLSGNFRLEASLEPYPLSTFMQESSPMCASVEGSFKNQIRLPSIFQEFFKISYP